MTIGWWTMFSVKKQYGSLMLREPCVPYIKLIATGISLVSPEKWTKRTDSGIVTLGVRSTTVQQSSQNGPHYDVQMVSWLSDQLAWFEKVQDSLCCCESPATHATRVYILSIGSSQARASHVPGTCTQCCPQSRRAVPSCIR